MSYSNGIGNLQQALSSIATMASQSTEGTKAATLEGKHDAPPSVPEHADEARLSAAGGIMAQVLEGPDVRSTKIAALQQTIAGGSYNVSSSDVAAKMIESLLR